MCCETGRVVVGTAGWSIPTALAADFPGDGPHLARYARRMGCAEINSSFYRPHRAATYEKWAATVPQGFLFSVKVPKTVTHGASPVPEPGVLEAFLAQVDGLGETLGPLLVQLPPRRAFAPGAHTLLTQLRSLYPDGTIVVEPRHASWFGDDAEFLLRNLSIGRVAADPALLPAAAAPGGDPAICYYRLHGSPRMYYSSYSAAYLQQLAATLRAATVQTIVVFDNTAAGAALQNALELQAMLA